MPLALDFLAQRWGTTPWDLEDAPADRLQFYMNVVGAYNEAQADMAGLNERQPMYWMDDDE